jgi:hypothetical protein
MLSTNSAGQFRNKNCWLPKNHGFQLPLRKDENQAPPPDDPGNPTVDFHGEKRSNDTHQSTTDPEERLARKSSGHKSKPAYCGNVLIENRNGLVVDTALVMPSGTAERDAAVAMAERIEGDKRVTVGADKGYDTRGFVGKMRERNVTPHVSQNTNRSGGSAIDGRTTRHAGYQASLFKVGSVFTFAAAPTTSCG